MSARPALLLIGHGSRSAAGVDEYWQFADVLRSEANGLEIGCGFIELAEPDLDTAIDALVSRGVTSIGAVPLVLLGAGHMKNDGPAALERGRRRHQGVRFEYGRALGIHPLVLALAEDRVRAAVGADDPCELAVVLVGRGSSDPDANADLYKVGRLLQDSRGLGLVEPAFISLAPPSVPEALERCRRLGATTIAVVPYFLFTGILVDRIHAQAETWAADHPDVAVRHGAHLGPDPRIARLVVDRYREAITGAARMNCDCCVYRTALPGYEARVGQPVHHVALGEGGPHDGAMLLVGADPEVNRIGRVPDEHLGRVRCRSAINGSVLREAREHRRLAPHRLVQGAVHGHGGLDTRHGDVELFLEPAVYTPRSGGGGDLKHEQQHGGHSDKRTAHDDRRYPGMRRF